MQLLENKYNNNTAQHHGTITHLQLGLELFYGKQQTSRRKEMRDNFRATMLN
jgi:hypothetical protein